MTTEFDLLSEAIKQCNCSPTEYQGTVILEEKKNCKQKCWSLQVPRFNYFREFSDYRACRDNWDELGKLDKLKHLNWESKENEKVKVHRRFFQREDCWTVRILNICTGSQLTIQLTSTYIWGNYSKCLANRGVCLPWGVL